MKVLIDNKALLNANFILIQNWFNRPIEPESNQSKSYFYIVPKKEKRYTLEGTNDIRINDSNDLFIWPYKNLSMYANKTFGLKII